jgi:hypothetical protein
MAHDLTLLRRQKVGSISRTSFASRSRLSQRGGRFGPLQCEEETPHTSVKGTGTGMDTRRQVPPLMKLVVAFLTVTAVMIGLVGMHVNMLSVPVAAPHSHAMTAASGDRPSTPSRMTIIPADHGSWPVAPSCGMCDDGCLMAASACITGALALPGGLPSFYPPVAFIQALAPYGVAVVARSQPLPRPPSLTVLSISRV